jgi:hypothetical protein
MPFVQGYFCIFMFDRTMKLLHYPCHSNFLPWIRGLGNNFLIICLLLLIDFRSVFGFVQIKTKKVVDVCKARVSNLIHRLWVALWLTSVVAMAFPPHHLIRLGVLFLPGWRVYCGSIRFGRK